MSLRLIGLVALVGLAAPDPAAQTAAFVVNTLASESDGACGPDGADAANDCSLADALAAANADPDRSEIHFDVVGTIVSSGDLTATAPVVVDGTANGRAAGDVVIDGPGDLFAVGLRIGFGASGSVVRGLTFATSFYGLRVEADGVTVEGNYVGTDPDGTDLGNEYGVSVFGADVTVGRGNVVGFNGRGIQIESNATDGVPTAQRAVVVGNYVGTDADGRDLGNGTGVSLTSRDGRLGGADAEDANVIGHNGLAVAVGSFGGNRVVGNWIGTDPAGRDLGNGEVPGVGLVPTVAVSSGSNTVGGDAEGEGNVIAFSRSDAVSIALSVGGPPVEGNRVVGNWIGTDAAGADLGNIGNGVVVTDASGTVIGGEGPGHGNTIGFNRRGVSLRGTSTGTVVEGNFIGTDATGADLGNASSGVYVGDSASGNRIGGTSPAAANAIRFQNFGVFVSGDAVDNAVLGNAISDHIGLGIDLVGTPYTPEPTDPGDADAGPNGLQNRPAVVEATSDGFVGFTLTSTPSADFRVELFANAAPGSEGNGEGARPIGAVDVRTGSDGVAPGFVGVGPIDVGEWVTATATPRGGTAPGGWGGTSEFSQAVEVTAGTASGEPAAGALALAAWPNPSAGRVTVALALPEADVVAVHVVDALGRVVATLHDGALGAGRHRFELPAGTVAAGAYAVRAVTSGGALRRAVTVVD